MSEPGLIVVDWTNSVLDIGVLGRRERGYELRTSFTLPTRTVLRQESQGEISYLFGADAVDRDDDEHTILFRHPGRDLPKIEDIDLQTELLTSFWRGLHDSLIKEGVLSSEQVAPVYLIPPAGFTLPLLEQLRSSAAQTPLRLCSTITPATALIMGILGLDTFVEDLIRIAGAEEITAGCFVLREEFVEGVCFYYRTSGRHHHSIVIRDYFQVTSDELSVRLSDSDCSDLAVLLVVEDSECSDSVKGRSIAFLDQFAGCAKWKPLPWPAEVSLRLKGCGEIARFAAGEATKPDQYEISHVYNLGVQINQSRFYPLIAREQLRSGKFPTAGSQPFRLSRKPTNGLRLNFCGGYSTNTAESLSLGRVVLSDAELKAITADTFLTASIRLDTSGTGEFFLGVMPENRIFRQQAFILPGLA